MNGWNEMKKIIDSVVTVSKKRGKSGSAAEAD